MKSNRKIILLTGLVILMLFNRCVNDYPETCIRGISVSFHSKTPCQPSATYPDWINDITVCVFDDSDILQSYRQLGNVTLDRDYREEIETDDGLYTVIAWAGLDNVLFDINSLQPGQTRKSDLIFRLRRAQNTARSIEGTRLYFGESKAVYIPEKESVFEPVNVNLLEITNRLTITVEGLTGNLTDYSIDIEADNGSMNINGSIADDDIFKYSRELSVDSDILASEFTTLKLETGYENTIVINDIANGAELYRGSLLGTLLLKNPNVNLNCDHDFTIRFTANDQCGDGTYIMTEIWVNNWLVHSYDTPM